MLAEFDIVEMRRVADPVYKNKLMLRPIQRTHACIRLVPEAEVKEASVAAVPDRWYVVHMPPVHTDKVHCTIS